MQPFTEGLFPLRASAMQSASSAAAPAAVNPVQQGRIYRMGPAKNKTSSYAIRPLKGNFPTLGYEAKAQYLEQVRVEFDQEADIPPSVMFAACFNSGFPEGYFQNKKNDDIVAIKIKGMDLELKIVLKARKDSPRDPSQRHPLMTSAGNGSRPARPREKLATITEVDEENEQAAITSGSIERSVSTPDGNLESL